MKKKKLDELVNLFVNDVKNLPKIEKGVTSLLKKIDKPFTMSDNWKDNYQNVSELELNAKKILEKLTPLTALPIGIGDSFIILRIGCEKAKEGLMERRAIDKKTMTEIGINRKNFVGRVRNFIKDLEIRERKDLRRILTIVDENRELKERILKLQVENEKLRRLVGK